MQRLDWVQHRVYDRASLARESNVWRASQKKIVFTNGCFDILHRGHLDLLARAADLGNILVVGLNSDASVRRLKGPERPVTNEKDRLFQLASLLCVDAVCLFDEDTPEQIIREVRPDTLVKGGDYTLDKIVGAGYVQECGGQVAVIPFVDGYSTSSIISRIKKL